MNNFFVRVLVTKISEAAGPKIAQKSKKKENFLLEQ
jgi:hypothetical protein